MNTWFTAIGGAVIALAVNLSGCGGAKTEAPAYMSRIVPVSGTVTFNGEPLADATILFEPEQTGEMESAAGATDAEGKYELKTIVVGQGPQMGAVPGAYRVVVTKFVMPDGSKAPSDMSDADAEAEGARELIPERYSDFGSTTLTADVPEGGGTVDFDL